MKDQQAGSDRYVVISSDCHAGADLRDYKPAADFPHHEGSSPYSRLALRGTMAGYPEDDIRKLLAGNAAKLYGTDMDLLQMAADRVGPSVDEVNEPLGSEEIPEDPKFGFIIETYLGMSNIVGPKKG